MADLMADPQARADLLNRTGQDLDNFGKEVPREQLRRQFRDRRERLLDALGPGASSRSVITTDYGIRNAKPAGTKPTVPPENLLPGTCTARRINHMLQMATGRTSSCGPRINVRSQALR